MSDQLLTEFLTVAAVHILAAMSPGPDLAIVLKHSVLYGRRTAIYTSIGIALGILVHVSYSLLGIAVIISKSILLFNAIKVIGGGYLIWIGCKALLSKPQTVAADDAIVAATQPELATTVAIRQGFLVNAFNPKVTLFFLALFSVVIKPTTPLAAQAFYGAWMCLATAAWFSFVALCFSHRAVRGRFLQFGHWFERAIGVVLIGLGLRVAAATVE